MPKYLEVNIMNGCKIDGNLSQKIKELEENYTAVLNDKRNKDGNYWDNTELKRQVMNKVNI